jgi:hypothetical protein
MHREASKGSFVYRPQFPFFTPPLYRDKDAVQYFDQVSTPLLNSALNLAVGGMILGIPLQLDADAPFTWRGIKVNGPANFALKFRDPYGNYLSDDWINIPLEYGPEETSVYGSNVVDIEPAIACPHASVILVDVMRVS